MYRNDISDADIIRASNTCISAAEAARKLGINYKTYRDQYLKNMFLVY